MSTTAVVVLIVLVVLVLAVVGVAAGRRRRTKGLQQRFGPEYEHTVQQNDSRRDAERELRERAARREELDIRELDPVRREEFGLRWRQAQEEFVDRPGEAVRDAQSLVTQVMRERGYPVDDHDEAARVVSVDHADVMDQYRSARDISHRQERGQASTEQLRQAMVHYRALFGRLLGDPRRDDAYPADGRSGARERR